MLREVWLALEVWELPEETTPDLWPRIESEVHRLEGRLDMSEYSRRTNGAFGELWSNLDAWELGEEKRDLWPRIEMAARKEPRTRVGWFRRFIARLTGKRTS